MAIRFLKLLGIVRIEISFLVKMSQHLYKQA